MYCFHCGAPLVDSDGTLTCSATGMPLSSSLAASLRARFVPRSRTGPAPLAGPGTFYCPGCGEAADPSCPNCGWTQTARDRFEFVELHPHEEASTR